MGASAIKNQVSLSLLNAGQAAIIAIGVTLVMVLAARDVVEHRMTVGDVVLVATFITQLYAPLNFLGFVYREIKHSLADIERMFKLLGVNLEVADAPGAKSLDTRAATVRFDHVGFAYESKRQILHDVDFTIPAGQTLAVVGASGAGKSTLSRLMFRFYDATSGAVRINGEDIRSLTQDSLRAHIGIVPQDTVLFNDTVYYNIAYGKPGATREEVMDAARSAHIHDFVSSLPDGYDTMVGERGLKLSGGEKQRVAIARTILKNPPILIFDEATSALDSRTEKAIQRELTAISANRTTLIIAHRLSTIVDATASWCWMRPGGGTGQPPGAAGAERTLCRNVAAAAGERGGGGRISPAREFKTARPTRIGRAVFLHAGLGLSMRKNRHRHRSLRPAPGDLPMKAVR